MLNQFYVRGLLFVAVLFYCTQLNGQSITFNKSISLGCSQTYFNGVEATDSFYYVTGMAYDTSNCLYGALVAKFDTVGTLTDYEVHSNPIYHETTGNLLKTTVDEKNVAVVRVLDSLGYHASLIHYNDQGGIEHEYIVEDSGVGRDSIIVEDVACLSDSGYLIAYTIPDSLGFSMIRIKRIDKYETELWTTSLVGGTAFRMIKPRIFLEGDGGFVIGYQIDNCDQFYYCGQMQCVLEKLDSVGNSIWFWQNSFKRLRGANDMVKTQDEGWIVASAVKVDPPQGGVSPDLQNIHVFKLDSNRNLLWEKTLYGDLSSWNEEATRIFELSDSSFLVLGIVTDTINDPPLAPIRVTNGYAIKISSQGDSLWSARYTYSGSTFPHTIRDAKKTKDGGFIIVGNTGLNGWLLKLDSCACLVPGCEIFMGQNKLINNSATEIRVYPNPSKEKIYIEYKQNNIQERISYTIIDVYGRIVGNYTANRNSFNFNIDELSIHDLVPGTYFLEIEYRQKRIQTVPFIKKD